MYTHRGRAATADTEDGRAAGKADREGQTLARDS